MERHEKVKARKVEQLKYERMYQLEWYRMGSGRRLVTVEALKSLNPAGMSLLDVGCGRGEFLEEAQKLGVGLYLGVESANNLVDLKRHIQYGFLPHLPLSTSSWDIVTCFDVLEHLPPFDTEESLQELKRVGRKHWLLTAADYSHVVDGVELHVNARPVPEWEALFKTVWPTVRKITHPYEDFTHLWYCGDN